MKYTSEEALAEIMRRKDQIVLRRSRRSCQMLSGKSCVLAAFLLHDARQNRLHLHGHSLRLVPAFGRVRRLCPGGGDRLRAGRLRDAAVPEDSRKKEKSIFQFNKDREEIICF